MSLIIDTTTVKKIIYDGTAIKKAYCGDTQVFSADHTVTYIIKGQRWTAVVEDGENAVTTAATNTARGKLGSGDTFVGWTTTSGSTSAVSSIPCTDDGMVLYGIWRHSHVGTNTVKAGCYQGAASSYNPASQTGTTGQTVDPCGCTHQTWYWRCNVCGATWSSTTNYSGACTQGHHLSDSGSPDCPQGHRGSTVYALSCGKTAGTFCG